MSNDERRWTCSAVMPNYMSCHLVATRWFSGGTVGWCDAHRPKWKLGPRLLTLEEVEVELIMRS